MKTPTAPRVPVAAVAAVAAEVDVDVDVNVNAGAEVREADAVRVAFVDEELLTRKKEEAKARIEHAKRIAEEEAKHRRELREREAREEERRRNDLAAARAEAIRLEAQREHAAWRAKNPVLAEEEDRLRETRHRQDVERMRHEAELERLRVEREQREASERFARRVKGVLGAAVGYYLASNFL